jgi:hypothetical protein
LNDPLTIKEPLDCPRCKGNWAIYRATDGFLYIYCSNPKCTFAWRGKGKSLKSAIDCWNEICDIKGTEERIITPLLIRTQINKEQK